ncbi:MAG: AAA family ATPase [Lachnospiraceae bacterium]|nr:AAA family ATPase [Lachnospiraceae bacterium]
MTYTPLPIGIDDFQDMIVKGYYYVDKTWLIKELLDKKGKVNLFTRPRRFGKTLNMSMLKYFFEKPQDGKDYTDLFAGMKIMDAGKTYTREQQQYPVITLTLKSAKQPDWDMAYASMAEDIANEFDRHSYVLKDGGMLEEDKEKFKAIRGRRAERIDYAKSLAFLSKCLSDYYQKKTIILIDEYDVPLENAYYAGFYDEMIAFIRSLFESALKTNLYLEFAVITGCLRISRESVFTGLNNLKMISIMNEEYSEHFGFEEQEVKDMLGFYHRENHMDTMKSWYDGYLFGNTEVYNPWSVINFMERLCINENSFPTAAWSNTSSNSIVRDLIYRADPAVKAEIEALVNGGTIEKQIHEDITYDDIYQSENNLWNFLFFTGYLKACDRRMEMDSIYITFALPNREVRSIYVNTIMSWFRDEVKEENLQVLYSSLVNGDVEIFERELEHQLQKTISYMDGEEAFYHGFLLGILRNMNWITKSNREAGDGRYDILIRSPELSKTPVILELKTAKKRAELEKRAEDALAQIHAMGYDADLYEEGYSDVLYCGLGFFRKQVRVKMERHELN